MNERYIPKELFLTSQTILEISNKLEINPNEMVRRVAPFKEQLDLNKNINNIYELKIPHAVAIQVPFIHETETYAEDWMTTTFIADQIGVDYKWVNRRILFIESTGAWRLREDNYQSAFHLPPDALDELSRERNKALHNFESGTRLTRKQIAKILKRHELWVANRLDKAMSKLKAQPELGLDTTGKTVYMYPYETIDFLKQEINKYPDSGNRLTIPMLAQLVEKDREWII